MTWINLHLVDGIPRPTTVDAVETELCALSTDFAAGWAAVQAQHPTATLNSLFAGPGGLSAEAITDLADAARMSGSEPPDLLRWLTIECPDDLIEELLPVLQQLRLVDWVEPRPVSVPASRDGVVSWGTNPKAVGSPAIYGSPFGVDTLHAWRVDGGTGLGVTVADVERGWFLGHEDLLTAKITKYSVFSEASPGTHGTCVAGVLVGADNGVGIVGICPDAELLLVTPIRADGVNNLAVAVMVATKAVGAGGVVLIEQADPIKPPPENGPHVLVEVERAVHEAISKATQLGVTIIEPAGNGSIDLDHPPKLTPLPGWGFSPLDLTLPTKKDSGAIVVGAGTPTVIPAAWRPHDSTTRGSRVDCFAHGAGIPAPTTPGSSDFQEFDGTSAASAVVAGVVASMQGMALAAGQGPLHPNEVRNLLRDHRLGTPLAPGFTGIGSSMPDLRKIARARGWARALPVAAVPVAANAALLVYLDDEDHVVRRHYTSFTGWGSPLRVIDRGYLLPAQPTAVSTATPGRLLHQALASGPGGLHRAWWDSNLGEEPFTLIPASRDFAPGTTVAAVDAGATDLVLVGIDAKARLAMALPAGPAYPGSSFTIGGPALFRMTTGPVAVSVAAGHVEAFAVADHGTLVWCHGDAPFEDPWQPPVVEPTLTSFVPGARLAALSVDGQVLVAAVGVQGWLHAVQVDPSQGGGPTAFSTPVVIDTAAAIAAQGPLALARLTSTDSDLVLAFGVDTDGAVQVSDRPAAGGDWSPMRRIPSPVKASPLGGVVAITMPERGVMVFAVGVDGKVLSAQSLTPGHWDGFAPLPEGLSAPPIPPDPSPPPTPGSPLISAAFKGEPILEAIAANTDRISRTRNTPSSAVGKIQHALLVWDPGALPVHGEDQKYGDETAAAVRRFKEIALSVAPTQVIDDVGPATVLQLDKIQAASEGLLGKQTTLRFFTEYGEVAGGLAFSVTTAEAIKLLTTDAAGRASVHLTAPGRVELDTGSALNAVGNLLGRPWPPPAGFPDAPVLTPAANSSVMVQPGDVLDIVVATRVNLTAQLVSPLTGTLRVDGQGVAISETAGSVTLALQATGGRAATVLVDPLAPAMALPDLPPLVGWTPIGTYTVRPGDTEEGLAELFVGDPAGYAEISDHPPVPGEQLTLPVTPGWLRLATHSVSAPDPVPWFTVTPDRIVAAMLASGDPESVVDVTGVLDRPPAPGIDAGTDLSARAEALVVLLQGAPVGPDTEVEESA